MEDQELKDQGTEDLGLKDLDLEDQDLEDLEMENLDIKVMEKRCVKAMDSLQLNVWPFPAVNGMMEIVGQLWVRINVWYRGGPIKP